MEHTQTRQTGWRCVQIVMVVSSRMLAIAPFILLVIVCVAMQT